MLFAPARLARHSNATHRSAGAVPQWMLGPLLALLLAGCGGGGATTPAGVPPAGPAVASGHVFSGQHPVAGAAVKLYAAGDRAGVAPALLASAGSDAGGKFDIASLACPSSNSEIYYIAEGGDTGSGPNAALHLMAVLGQCGSIPQSAVINELTTSAAAYALAQFLGATGTGTALSSADQISGSPLGLEVGVRRALGLVDAGHGSPGGALPAASDCSGPGMPLNCEAELKLDTLADALTACGNGSDAASGSCIALFCAATPGASYDSVHGSCSIPALPKDTLQAALSVTLNPGTVSMQGIQAVAESALAYAPALVSAPGDWALALNFTGGGLGEPAAVAVDAGNNLWVANYNGVVSEFDAQGVPVSAKGYSGGGLEESFAIAIAADGNVWVTNEQSSPRINSGQGSLTVLAPDGSILSGDGGYQGGGLDFPLALAIDAAGNAWVANEANASISSFAPGGTARSPYTGYTGSGLGFPSGVAIDAAADVWVSNTSSDAITKLSNNGSVLSGSSGYTGGGLSGPSAIALDEQGNAWVCNYYGNSVTALSGGGQPLGGTPYGAGHFTGPAGIAVDAAGTVWVTNYHGASLSTLAGAEAATPGAALSPESGFAGGGLSLPFNPAVDQAGNVWIGNSGNNSITEFIGLAAPVRTPLSGLPARP